MRKYFIHIALMLLPVVAMATPRLTVIVAVDGMHQQDLTALRSYWPQGGLRTLSEEAFQTELSIPCIVYGGAETAATLFSGTTPQENGVAMDRYFLRSDRKVHALFEDATYKGIGTQQRLSPTALLSMTMTDRFRVQMGDKAQIYAIGLDPATTLCMAGHSANACCWFDAETSHWATTSYYSEGLPTVADRQNTGSRISELSARQWLPRMDVAQYMHPTDLERKKGFSYTGFEGGKTPAMNDLIAELALDLQRDRHLGEDIYPDLLLLQMTVRSPKAKADHIATAEQEDMYLSVNQDLGYLMEQLDKRIGHQNYQMLVIGLPRQGSSAEMLQRTGLTRREFNTDRAVALIGTYLMAIYGHERWVDGGFGQTIFLNRTLIEQKKLSLETIRRQVSDFLLDFEGIQGAAPASELPLLNGTGETARLRESQSKRNRGDVVFWLEENWVVMEQENKPLDYVADRDPRIPLLMWSGSYRNYPEKSTVNALGLYNLLFE